MKRLKREMSSKNLNSKRVGLPPGQKPIDRLLRWGKDHPTIGGSVPKIDLRKWILRNDLGRILTRYMESI